MLRLHNTLQLVCYLLQVKLNDARPDEEKMQRMGLGRATSPKRITSTRNQPNGRLSTSPIRPSSPHSSMPYIATDRITRPPIYDSHMIPTFPRPLDVHPNYLYPRTPNIRPNPHFPMHVEYPTIRTLEFHPSPHITTADPHITTAEYRPSHHISYV